MEDFRYKEYTEEESRLYTEAMDKIMTGLQKGISFQEACAGVDVQDSELKAFIIDDALKILIADIHYTKGLPLQQVADTYHISMDIINKANQEMMEDIEISSSQVQRVAHPDRPVGNA